MTWAATAYFGYEYLNKDAPEAPPPPGPTAEETELRQLQNNLLKDQARKEDLFEGFKADQMGYNALYKTPTLVEGRAANPELAKRIDDLYAKRLTTDKDAEYTEITQQIKDLQNEAMRPTIKGFEKTAARTKEEKQLEELRGIQLQTSARSNKALNEYLDSLGTPEAKATQAKLKQIEAQQADITLQQGERQKLALEGKLPISQGTIDRKNQEFQLLKESMARAGNPIIGDDPEGAYSLTTSGATMLDQFKRRYGTLEDQERRGELSQGSQLYSQSVGVGSGMGAMNYGMATGNQNMGSYAATSPGLMLGSPVGSNAGLIQGAGQAMQPYAADRGLLGQQQLTNAMLEAQQRAGNMQLLGAGLGAGAMLLSSKSSKRLHDSGSTKDEDLTAVSLLSKGKIHKWNYKHEPDGAKPHIGVVTEEAPDAVVSGDGKHLDVASYLGALTSTVRSLNRKIDLISKGGK